jgi:hypothetical protein
VQDIVLRAIANPTLHLSQDYLFKFSAWIWKAHKNDLRQRPQENYLRNKDIGRVCTFHNLNGQWWQWSVKCGMMFNHNLVDDCPSDSISQFLVLNAICPGHSKLAAMAVATQTPCILANLRGLTWGCPNESPAEH